MSVNTKGKKDYNQSKIGANILAGGCKVGDSGEGHGSGGGLVQVGAWFRWDGGLDQVGDVSGGQVGVKCGEQRGKHLGWGVAWWGV